MKKIVVASDSFKGSISSHEIGLVVEAAIHEILPDCEVVRIPVADGGEGTTEALLAALQGAMIRVEVHDPLMRRIFAEYGISGDNRTAWIEMASAGGLTLLAPEERNPMVTTTYGTGEMIRDALQRGCRRFLMGIGGSATNDAGTGMLQALGYCFLDAGGEPLGGGGQILKHICKIEDFEIMPELREAVFTIACDVDNPFSGERGAARVYAAQKGADESMIRELDEGLKHFSEIITIHTGQEIDVVPGAGAAGGLGGALLAFLHAVLKPGVQVILDAIGFLEKINGADLVITGEGKMDKQTAMGKTPYGVLKAATEKGIPVIAIAGAIEDREILETLGFKHILPIHPEGLPEAELMDKELTRRHIRKAVIDFMHSRTVI